MEAHEQKIQERIERILGPEINVLLDNCDFMKDFQEKLYWEFKSEFQKKLERRIAAQDIEDRMRKLDVGAVSDADELEDDARSRKSKVSEATDEAPETLKGSIPEDALDTESEGSAEAFAGASSSSSTDFSLFSQKEEFEKYTAPEIQKLYDAKSIEELYAMAEEEIAYYGALLQEDKSRDTEAGAESGMQTEQESDTGEKTQTEDEEKAVTGEDKDAIREEDKDAITEEEEDTEQ